MATASVFQLLALAIWLVWIIYGVRAKTPGTRLLAPVGIMGLATVAIYFAFGSVHVAAIDTVAGGGFLAALAWAVSLIKQRTAV